MKKTAIILYSDAKREYFATEEQYISEAEVKGRAEIIEKYLQKMGYTTQCIPADETFIEKVRKLKPDIVFNLVDSIRGEEYLCSSVPAALEILNVPYSGTGQLGLAISSNKFLTNKLLEQAGVKVPKYQLFSEHTEKLQKHIKYPVISKLNSIHGSIEMGPEAVSENEKQLKTRLKFLIKTYKDDVLVSEYIEGREIAAIILKGKQKKVYTGEKVLLGKWANVKYKILSFDAVWGNHPDSYHFRKFRSNKEVREIVKKAYSALKMDDYAKFDIRINKRGVHYFIDANPNCSLGPKEAGCDIGEICHFYNVSFIELLKRIIRNSKIE